MQKVEGSNPFIRSMHLPLRGDVAEWLRHGSAKPATPVQFRPSPPQDYLRKPASGPPEDCRYYSASRAALAAPGISRGSGSKSLIP